uniref:DNA-directed RNA polymerase subunit n=1 Tax=Oryza glumipatula TaxID=40148 RepID=A0A0E0A5L8_9ORYZ
MDALREAEARLTVYVHPSNAADVRRAVARQLSSLLFSYEDRFDGVLLAHEATVESEQGKILNGLVPYFGVPVHANLLLYSPKPDMMLEGKVEMLGKESIHAIVLGVFSAAIMSDDIHEKFKFKRKKYGGKFVSRSDKQHVIKKGSMIRFSVKRSPEKSRFDTMALKSNKKQSGKGQGISKLKPSSTNKITVRRVLEENTSPSPERGVLRKDDTVDSWELRLLPVNSHCRDTLLQLK